MIQYEKVKEMPLYELITYHGALKNICEHYERGLKPYFNAHDAREQAKWVEINTELQHAKLYYDIVFNALKNKVFNSLDNYELPVKKEKEKAIAKKKPATQVRRAKKEKKS
jgi:hypothetical protein